MSPMEANVDPLLTGSRLGADHPENGVLIPCLFTFGVEIEVFLIFHLHQPRWRLPAVVDEEVRRVVRHPAV